METKNRNVHSYHRKRLKWAVRNNFVFIVIVGTICIIVGLIYAMEIYNYGRIKRVETLLGKDVHTIHRITGMTDEDIKKLQKEYPDFNWEGTWDSQRWKQAIEKESKARSRLKAKEK